MYIVKADWIACIRGAREKYFSILASWKLLVAYGERLKLICIVTCLYDTSQEEGSINHFFCSNCIHWWNTCFRTIDNWQSFFFMFASFELCDIPVLYLNSSRSAHFTYTYITIYAKKNDEVKNLLHNNGHWKTQQVKKLSR